MYRISSADFAALALVALASCVTMREEEDVFLGTAPAPLETINALNPNALNPNALNPNALIPNALIPNALAPGALSSAALSAIQDPGAAGELSRQFLRYVIGCALTPSQSFSFSWTDADGTVHEEVYEGLIGLAPGWATKPLGKTEQEWVSACLGSRTNWYGSSVIISSRASHPVLDKTGSAELSTYTRQEGAFWGNLFTASPYLHACYYEPNRSYARTMLRECAAGHLDADGRVLECGIIRILGACEDHCLPLNPRGMYYPTCANNLSGPPAPATKVITVFIE